MKYELTLYHFFPDKLNLYGDRGNIIVLKKRAEWRDIDLKIVNVSETAELDLENMDLFFIGGGSDREQDIATKELVKIKEPLKNKIESGTPGLTICGGYQFLGTEYLTASGEVFKGLGILDFYTEAKEGRLIGNILIESEVFGKVIGFENHGGRTYHSFPTLGSVVKGYGNNDEDQKEGIHYKNLIGTYMHGPLLPKNPKIADYLLLNALQNKYTEIDFSTLDDSLENQANETVWARYISN